MRIVIPVAGLAALAALIVLAVQRAAPRVEAEVASRAAIALIDAGVDWASVTADGRRVRVSGVAPDDTARQRALQRVASVDGVRDVYDATSVAPAAAVQASALVITRESGLVVLTGSLSNHAAIDGLAGAAAAIFDGDEVRNRLSVSATVQTVPVDLAAATLEALEKLGSGTLSLTDATAYLGGVAASPAARERAAAALALALPEGFSTEIDVDVPRASQSAATCQAALDDLLREGIAFEPNDTAIRNASHTLLDQVASVLRACPGLDISVGAHTDSGGEEPANVALTAGRAAAVRDFLVARGVEPARIDAIGYGSSRPIASDDTAAGRRKNRRITVTIGMLDP